MAIAPFLGIFASPLAFLLELIGAVGLLYYATTLEHAREADETPRIIRPFSEPEKPKRHWFWLKLAIVSGSLSLLVALSVFMWLRYAPHPSKTVIAEHKASPPEPTSAPAHQGAKPAKLGHESPPRVVSSLTPRTSSPKEDAKASDKALPPASVVIPIPDHQPTPKPPENSVEPTAAIGGQPVRASDKPPGTLYVSIRVSDVTRYRGTLDENTTRDAVKAALEKTGKLKVFLGNNDVGRPGQRRYGVGNLAPDKPHTVYYFSKTLEDACTAIKGIISAVIGVPVGCVLIAPPTRDPDPDSLNLLPDFWLVSGLDMEIVL